MPPVSEQQKLEQAMSEMFKTLDRNKDNKINKEELRVLIGKVFGSKPNEVPPQLVDFVMKEADKDKSGAISEDELKHALSCLTGIAIMLTLTEEFKKIDTDKNGYLTKNELAALVKGSAKGKGGDTVQALLEGLDMDGDGKVTLEEFLTVCCQGLVAQAQ